MKCENKNHCQANCSRGRCWAGWIITAIAGFPFILSSLMKFTQNPQAIEGMTHLGWTPSMLHTLGVLEITCVVIYLLPRFSVLGAILLTGYLGGAIATHLRLGEPIVIQSGIGIFIWLGLFLREPRLAEILPIRTKGFSFEREIIINRSAASVYNHLKFLKNFKVWNPFEKKDPNIKNEYRGTDGEVGFVSAWNGNRTVGSGEMEISKLTDGKRIDFELRFFTPFKATNQGFFLVEVMSENQCKVKWGMSGHSNFPACIFSLFISMEKMIGKEFESGLKHLKEILEK